jgi:hypothetical protein
LIATRNGKGGVLTVARRVPVAKSTTTRARLNGVVIKPSEASAVVAILYEFTAEFTTPVIFLVVGSTIVGTLSDPLPTT